MAELKNRVVLPGSERSARAGSRVVGAPDPHEVIEISILVRPRQPLHSLAAVEEMGATAPHQRKYLSRDEYAAAYGADPDDLNKIQAFAHDHNLTVVEVSPARRTVVLSGTIAAFSAAYGVYLATYEHADGSFRGRTGPIYVPDDLSGIVQGIFGFDNRPQARPHFRHFRRKTDQISPMRASTQPAYTPPQVAALYNFPTGADGTGQCIGILEFGGGYTARDLETYFKQLGMAVPSVTAVSVDRVHNKPAPGQDSPDTEVLLDIEVAGAVAPGAKLAVYFSHFTERGWVDAVTTAIHDSHRKPSVLSISWGFAEGQDIWSQAAIQAVNEAFQAGAAMGVTICCAAGDDGSRDQITDGHAHVDFPSSSAFVLACGGTTLHSSGNNITSESVWNDGPDGGSTGGGVSDAIALPSWQAAAKVPPSVNPGKHVGRGVPDVAGNADPETGYQVFADGQAGVVGGTSAVAPLWAGLIARLNQLLGTPVGFVNPLLYGQVASAKAFHDITKGNNDITGQIGGYPAGPGWDACTGLGSPDGTAIATALAGAAAAASGKK
jgi:kumamolisin